MLTSLRKANNQEQALLARTGITKAGFLLKRQDTKWTSSFVVLNDHCLITVSEKDGFEKPDTLLLTTGTRVYQQNGEEGVVRIETGVEVLFVKGNDVEEMKKWKKAVATNTARLANLARGQLRVKSKGRMKEYFVMLHRWVSSSRYLKVKCNNKLTHLTFVLLPSRECIVAHPSVSQTNKIDILLPITRSSSFKARSDAIIFNSGIKGSEKLTMISSNDIEHQHWCYALEVAIASLRSDMSKVIITYYLSASLIVTTTL